MNAVTFILRWCCVVLFTLVLKNAYCDESDADYRVYVKGFANRSDALYYQTHYTSQAYPVSGVTLSPSFNNLYWVYIGPFKSKEEMKAVTMEVHNPGYIAKEKEKKVDLKGFPFTNMKRLPQHKHATLQLGFYNTTQSAGNQHVNITSTAGNNYVTVSEEKRNFMIGGGLFLNAFENSDYAIDYGVNIYYMLPTSVTGNIYEEQVYDNFLFSYSYFNVPLYASLKGEMKTRIDCLNLVADFGIGPNFLELTNVREVTKDPEIIPNNAFSQKSQINFSVMAGAGVRINNVLGGKSVECGYRFFYLGEGKFPYVNSAFENGISTGINYQNALLCALVF